MRSLRGQLFRSHLLVMAVALGVMLIGALVATAALSVFVGTELVDLSGPSPADGGRRPEGSGSLGPAGLLLPLAAAVVAAVFVSWQVARRLAGPIEAARSATRRLAAGSYDVTVEGGSVGELVDLADGINHLAAELEASEKRRMRLIGDVAHELRNPLATIEASMEALMDGVVPATDETFARVAGEAARLRRLAADLGDLSAAVERATPSSAALFDIRAVIDVVIAQLLPQAEAKGLQLTTLPTAAAAGFVAGDRDRLTQVFTNIIGNAVQYTDSGTITVDLQIDPPDSPWSAEGPTLTVTVADRGRGLDPDETTRVFERFYRVDRAGEGTGIGLAIAKAVVDGHGGSISARSEGRGRGSSFVVTLPAVRP